MARVVSHSQQRTLPLGEGWTLARTPAGAAADPSALEAQALEWIPARVPGTAAQALFAAGKFDPANPEPLDAGDIWYRCSFDWRGGPDATLRLEGLATLCDVWLNGRHLLRSENMFHAHALPVSALGARNTLHLKFSSLLAWLKPKKGKVRWRPRMIQPPSLRFARTTVLGRAPSWCPEVQAVGPWREIRLEEGPLRVETASLRSRFDGRTGEVTARLAFAGPAAEGLAEITLKVGDAAATFRRSGPGQFSGSVRLEGVEPWWPRSHGTQDLYPVGVEAGGARLAFDWTGFRRLELVRDAGAFALKVNGERIFCRGACWTTDDLLSLPAGGDLGPVSLGNMNMVRVPGVAVYPSPDFFVECDRLGILVWQDFMFANFDYPCEEPGFRESVAKEARDFLAQSQLSPSLAVLCGGSEVEQQAAMLGLSAEERKSPLPGWLRDHCEAGRPDVPFVDNSPSGGALPFVSNAGCAHYYGVGAYRRPLEDARRAEVKFATEALGFANLPARGAFEGVPGWEARAPRDMGADHDFADVRDFYLRLLYRVDPAELRAREPDRYLALSAEVTGEVMAEVFAEWRRARSTCGGGLVWFFQDVWPAPGWGVVDALGNPKPAFHHLARAFAPRTLFLTDEGVNGLAIHVVNDRLEAFEGTVKLELLLDGKVPVARGEKGVKLWPNSGLELSAFELLPGFIDLTHAYKFGPPSHQVTLATLCDARDQVIAEAVHFPAGRYNGPTAGVSLKVTPLPLEGVRGVTLEADGFVQSVRLEVPGFNPLDGGFHLFPGRPRAVPLARAGAQLAGRVRGTVHAITLPAPIPFDLPAP